MTTVFINEKSKTGRRLLKDIENHPRIAQIVDDRDNSPLPKPVEEYHTLEKFKAHFEKRLYERLGLEVTL